MLEFSSTVLSTLSPYLRHRVSTRAYFRYFVCNNRPLNKCCAELCRKGAEPPGLSEHEIWHAKHLYDSAFHPDTGEKMFILGRMSAQVPMNMSITGCMMTFYKLEQLPVFHCWTLDNSFTDLL